MISTFEKIDKFVDKLIFNKPNKNSVKTISYTELRKIVLNPKTDQHTLMKVMKQYEDGIHR